MDQSGASGHFPLHKSGFQREGLESNEVSFPYITFLLKMSIFIPEKIIFVPEFLFSPQKSVLTDPPRRYEDPQAAILLVPPIKTLSPTQNRKSLQYLYTALGVDILSSTVSLKDYCSI